MSSMSFAASGPAKTPADGGAPAATRADAAAPAPPHGVRGKVVAAWRKLSYSWVGPLIRDGYRRQLNEDDLLALQAGEEAASLRAAFWRELAAGPAGARGAPVSGHRLLHTMAKVCRRELLLSGTFMFIFTSSQLANPLLLRGLVNALSSGDDAQAYTSLYYTLGLLCTGIVSAFSNQLQLDYSFAAGRKSRALHIALVFEHSLELSSAQLSSQSSQGQILNMVSADAQKLFDISQFVHLFWAGPFQILAAVVFLVLTLGTSALAGVAVLCFIAPINWWLAKMNRSVRTKHMPAMDARVKLCTEVLAGIQVVKLFSWETPFFNKIKASREAQMVFVYRELHLAALGVTILILTPPFAALCTFAAYGLSGHVLTAGNTFAALSMLNVIKFPLQLVAQALMLGSQVIVASERLAAFLALGPRRDLAAQGGALAGQPSFVSLRRAVGDAESSGSLGGGGGGGGGGGIGGGVAAPDGGGGGAVSLSGASFAWSLEGPATLHGVDLDVRPGALTAVVGPVGSGKSSLVSALLGELFLRSGSFRPYGGGEVSLCTQTPWVINDTLENNVLFGKPFEEQRFRDVLNACCLWPDLDQLHEREKTVIGERGVTLSGGQKARIALARAAYSGAGLLIFDDPLSALDAHVGKQVFERLLHPRTGLLKDATRVLVTHAVQNLAACDEVVVLFEGRVAFKGGWATLEASARAEEAAKARMSAAEREQLVLGEQRPDSSGEVDGGRVRLASVMQSLMAAQEASEVPEAEVGGGSSSSKPSKSKVALLGRKFQSSRLMTEEERKEGVVDRRVLSRYIRASGGWTWVIFCLALMASDRAVYVCSDFWLATWTAAASGPPAAYPQLPAAKTQQGISFYAAGLTVFTFVNSFFVVARCFAFMHGGARAAGNIFLDMTWRVMRAPMVFFETTPLGRITNRFTFDAETVDNTLVQSLNGMVASSMWICSSVVVMLIVVPLAAVIVAPAMGVFVALHRYYRFSCTSLQRLDSTTRSPVQSHFREALEGLQVVRCFRQSQRYLDKSDALVDHNNRAIFSFNSSNRWLGLRLDLVATSTTFAVCLASWLSRGSVEPALIGLAVLWSFNLCTGFSFFIQAASAAEAKLTSVERVTSYATELPQEPPLATTQGAPPKLWPARGEVRFEGVSLRYRPELPPAVERLSLTVAPGEHIGVVGRTGAGKSSLSSCLFRLRELDEGLVSVDGVNLAALGLSDVRGRAAFIIPQAPTCFSGTVRFNLDPFSEFTDAQVEDALKRARLRSQLRDLGGILAPVDENGSNFSQGQRQLICLARAVLRKPKVLFLDEVSASVDSLTDKLVQETIRNEFRDATVIEVAHRLQSVILHDRIAVLERGQVVECDTPANLLAKAGGHFRRLVDGAGPAVAQELRAMLDKRDVDKRELHQQAAAHN
jgi:ATP-binding cassette subfamily C (CFTR/MRP) protein 2